MELTLMIAGLVLIGALLFVWFRQRKANKSSESPKRGKAKGGEGLDTLMSWHPQATRILTASERKAFISLCNGLPEHIILAQVPLARFLKVPTRHSYSEWLRRVGVMCADIVVCDNMSQVIAVVDIRAPEALENDRARQRHARMDRVLQAAEIPLHIWREDALPTSLAARNAILNMADSAVPSSAAASGQPPTGRMLPTVSQPVREIPGMSAIETNGEDDGMEMTDPPSSTWFDEMDSAAVPLSPSPPPPPRGSGPSIR